MHVNCLCDKSLYLKAGGADPRIFIQDESFPLRLAYHAKRFVALKEATIFAPKRHLASLSAKPHQAHHDRFLDYQNALDDFTKISAQDAKTLYQKAISTVWKAKRHKAGLAKYVFLLYYLYVSWFKPKPNLAYLAYLNHHYISQLNDVRKTY